MIQAIIDIGSNTVRMAIYEIERDRIEFIYKKKHMLGLASFLEKNIMSNEGVDRLCEVLEEYKTFLKLFSIENVIAFATAALRNCSNSIEAVEEIKKRTKINVIILSGEKEAEYDFVGATRNINNDRGLIVDIGGGSTELVYYSDGAIKNKTSLNIGSLGLKKEYCRSVLPKADEVKKMYEKAVKIVEKAADFNKVKSEAICGIGGTFKGMLALYNELYDMDKSNKQIDGSKIKEMIVRFGSHGRLNQGDSIVLMKSVPERINTIVSGMIIADVIIRRFEGGNIIYSDSGVREGYIYSEIMK